MKIIRNNTSSDVNIEIMGVEVSVKGNDEVLVDSVIGEKLQEIQPQLEYLKVPRNKEEAEIKRFKQKLKDEIERENERVEKEKEDIKAMEKRRKKNAERKRKEREASDLTLTKKTKTKILQKVARKLVKSKKITKKRDEKK